MSARTAVMFCSVQYAMLIQESYCLQVSFYLYSQFAIFSQFIGHLKFENILHLFESLLKLFFKFPPARVLSSPGAFKNGAFHEEFVSIL